MKYLQFLLLLGLIVSCQKETIPNTENSYPKLRASLIENLSQEDYNKLDFNRVTRTTTNGLTLIRIGLKGSSMQEQFILLDVNTEGVIKRGRIIELQKSQTERNYNGNIIIRSLNKTVLDEYRIQDGYRSHPDLATLTQPVQPSQPDPYIMLPEVIVVGSYPPGGGGISWGTWMNLVSFIDGGGGGGGGGWTGGYSQGDPFGGGGGGGYTGGGGSDPGTGNPNLPATPTDPNAPVDVIDDQFLLVDFESQFADPAIDINAYLRCFSQIPDAGATCKIGIYSDIPVDSDPSKMFNFNAGSPGHAFIRIEKQNGSQHAKQYIGLYPASGWKTNSMLTGAPGKLVDNGQHEYNAYMEVNITPDQLAQAIQKISSHNAPITYTLDHYNCTDFALAIWNAAASDDSYLQIPQIHIPGSMYPASNTPQGLYLQIKGLKESGNPVAAASQVNVEGNSGSSTGPCN